MADPKINNRVKLPTALACFVWALKPKPRDDGKEPSYQMCLLWPKKDQKALTELLETIKKIATLKFGPNAERDMKNGKMKGWPRDGNTTQPDRPEFKDMVYINCSSTRRPGVVQPNGSGGLEQVTLDDDIYSGCKVKAVITVYPFDKKENKGIGFGLQNVLVVEKGEKLAGGKSAEEDFKEESDLPATGTDGGGSAPAADPFD
jgi:hypothetical protein